MATETVHIVLTWSADKRGKLRAETPMKFKTADEARRRAERAESRFAGVVALSQGYDTETEQADENPTILFRAGRLPPAFDE